MLTLTNPLQAWHVGEDVCKEVDDVSRGMEELRSWDWTYGQTPEFSYSVTHQFDWGKAVFDVHVLVSVCSVLTRTLDE